MIGNDIVDLALARKVSNWKRKGFLDKIFSQNEQLLISNAANPEIMVWNLWSRKEAAYKIYNRQTGIRGYFPLQLECIYENQNSGTVCINENVYYTQTEIQQDFIYTEAVAEITYFKVLKVLNTKDSIHKTNGIPYCIKEQNQIIKPISISHHGRFWRGITL